MSGKPTPFLLVQDRVCVLLAICPDQMFEKELDELEIVGLHICIFHILELYLDFGFFSHTLCFCVFLQKRENLSQKPKVSGKASSVLLVQNRLGILLPICPDQMFEEELDELKVVGLCIGQDFGQICGQPRFGHRLLQHLLELEQCHIEYVDLLLFEAAAGANLGHSRLVVQDVEVLDVGEELGQRVHHDRVLQVLEQQEQERANVENAILEMFFRYLCKQKI